MRAVLLGRSFTFERLGHVLVALPGAALLVAACSSLPPPARPNAGPVAPKPTATSQAPSAGPPLHIFVAKRPEKLAVDGSLDEWSFFGPDEPSGAPYPAGQGPESSMMVAVTSEGVSLAAELAPGAGEALWLGLVTDVPEMPSPQECDAESMKPEDLASCEANNKANEAFAAEYRARFRRFYRIDAAGVSSHEQGALAPVVGARVAVKKARHGHRLEATFPARALPRTLQAPLETIYLYSVASAGQAPPALPIEELVPQRIDEPVGFEPHAALRQAVFADARKRTLDTPFNLSYEPGADLELEDVRYRGAVGTQLHSKPEVLYSKQAVLGAVEVGYVYTGKYSMVLPWISVIALKDGEPVEITDLDGAAKGVVQRDGELHVFAYSVFQSEGSPAATVAWSALAVGADGALRPDLLERAREMSELIKPVESHATDFSTLSLVGAAWNREKDGPGGPMEATWKYDAKEKRYLATVKGGSSPASKTGGSNKKGVPKKK